MFTTGLSATYSNPLTDADWTAKILGTGSPTMFASPALGASITGNTSKMMLWIGLAGLAVAVATYYKKGR